MNGIKIEKNEYCVKIDDSNNYVIYPHKCLKAKYTNDKSIIEIRTCGSNKLVLAFEPDRLKDIYYKDKFMDKVDYINKLL